MMPKKSKKRTKIAPYKSEFEKELHGGLLKDTEYEPFSVDYTVHRKYTPDFVIKDKDGNETWFEAKGRFRDYGDAQRYRAIRDQLAVPKMGGQGGRRAAGDARRGGKTGVETLCGDDERSVRFVFIFQDGRKRAYPQCKRRKDGTFLSLAEWAEHNEFEWCTIDTFKKEWLE